MKGICVSLETAKKLKEAGWEHKTFSHVLEPSPRGLTWELYREFVPADPRIVFYPAPTASEVAAVLPNPHKERGRLNIFRNFNQTYTACYELAFEDEIATADTMTDALAELWLKLPKEGK